MCEKNENKEGKNVCTDSFVGSAPTYSDIALQEPTYTSLPVSSDLAYYNKGEKMQKYKKKKKS